MAKELVIALLGLLGVLMLVVASWGMVLTSSKPLAVPLAKVIPWPVVCSTRGCITTRAWQAQLTRTEAFNATHKLEKPVDVKVLNTMARQHMVHHAYFRSPITTADAQRYRRDILNVPDDKVTTAAGLSAYEYDWYVLVPFLEQESLRQERSAETPEELFAMLAKERWMVALPRGITWDSEEGKLR